MELEKAGEYTEKGKKLTDQTGSNSGIKISDEEEKYLKDIYYNTKSPVAFSGFQKINKFIKKNKEKESITPKKLRIWLSKQEAYTSFFPSKRRFKRPRVIAFYKNYQWDTDTANMTKYKDYNEGYGYFVVFIDIFTRYLYTAPLKTLTGQEMVFVINDLFVNVNEKPEILRSVRGSEYLNRYMKKFLGDKNIKHIFTYYETKANYAERVIKTIKIKITKYLTSKETFRWIDIISDLTYSYNNSFHRSIKRTPTEAQTGNKFNLWSEQYAELLIAADRTKKKTTKKLTKSRNIYIKRYKFKVGDRVKISFLKRQFDREYSEKWSGEVFTVIERKMNQDIPMYKLKDYNNEVIESYFYEPELQLAYMNSEVVYKIEKIIKKRKKGNKREVLVKWKGWPERFNSWVLESELQDI